MANEPTQRIGNKFGQGIHDTFADGSSESRSERMQRLSDRGRQRSEEALALSPVRPGSLTGAASFTTGDISQATRMAFQNFVRDADQYLSTALATTPNRDSQDFLRRKHSMMVTAVETAYNSGRLFQEVRRLAGNIAMQGSVAQTVASVAQPGRRMVVLEQASQGAIGFILSNSLPIQGQVTSQSTAWPQGPQQGPAMPQVGRPMSPTPMQLRFGAINSQPYPQSSSRKKPMTEPVPPRTAQHYELQARIARGEVVSDPLIESFPGAQSDNFAHRRFGQSIPGLRRDGTSFVDPRDGRVKNYVGQPRFFGPPAPSTQAALPYKALADLMADIQKPGTPTGPASATDLQSYVDKLEVLSREPMIDARDRRRVQQELSETRVTLAKMRNKSGVSPTRPAMRQIAAASSASRKDAQDSFELSTGGNIWATASRRPDVGPHVRTLGLVPAFESRESASAAVRRQAIYERTVGGRLQGSDWDRAGLPRPVHGTDGFFSEQTSTAQLYARSAGTTNVRQGARVGTDYTSEVHGTARVALASKFVREVNKSLGPGEQPLPASGPAFDKLVESFNTVASYERRLQQFVAPAGASGANHTVYTPPTNFKARDHFRKMQYDARTPVSEVKRQSGSSHDSMQEKRAIRQIEASLPALPNMSADRSSRYIADTLGSQLSNIKEVLSYASSPIDTTGRRNVPRQVFPSKRAVASAYREQRLSGYVDFGLKAVEREDGEIGLGIDPNIDAAAAERAQREVYLRESLKRLETSQRDWEARVASGKLSQQEAIQRQARNKANQSGLINRLMDGWKMRRAAVESGEYDWERVLQRSEPIRDNGVNDAGYQEDYGNDESRLGEQAVDTSASTLMQITNQWSGFDPIENPYEMKGAIQTPEQHQVMLRQMKEQESRLSAKWDRYEKLSGELERTPAGGPASAAKRRTMEAEMQELELSFAQFTDPSTGEFRPGTMISGLSAPEMAARYGRRAERPIHSSYVSESEMGSAYESARAYAMGVDEDIQRERISQSNPDNSLSGVGYGVEFLKAGAMGRLKLSGDRMGITSDLGVGEHFRELYDNIRSQTEGFDTDQQDRMVSGWLSANGFNHPGPFNPILSVLHDSIKRGDHGEDDRMLRRGGPWKHLQQIAGREGTLRERIAARHGRSTATMQMDPLDFLGIVQSRAARMDRHQIDGWLADEQRLSSMDKTQDRTKRETELAKLRQSAFSTIMEPYLNDLGKDGRTGAAVMQMRISNHVREAALEHRGGERPSDGHFWKSDIPVAAMVGSMGFNVLDPSKGDGLFTQDPLKARVPSDRLVRNQGQMLEALLFPNDAFMNLDSPAGKALAGIRADQGLGNPMHHQRARQIKSSMRTIESMPIDQVLSGLWLGDKQPPPDLSGEGLVSWWSNRAADAKGSFAADVQRKVPGAEGKLTNFISALDKTPLGRWMLLNDEHDATWRLYNREIETTRRPAYRVHQLTQAMGDWYHDIAGGGLALGDEVPHLGLLNDKGMTPIEVHQELARERSDPNRGGFYYPLKDAAPRLDTFLRGIDPGELTAQADGNATGTRGPPDPLQHRTLLAAATAAAFEAIGGMSRDGYSVSDKQPSGRLNEISIDDSLSKFNQKRRDGRQDWLQAQMKDAVRYGDYTPDDDDVVIDNDGNHLEYTTKGVGRFLNTLNAAWKSEGGAKRTAIQRRNAAYSANKKEMSEAARKGLQTKAGNAETREQLIGRQANLYERYLGEASPIPFALRMLEGQASTSERRGFGQRGIETVSQAEALSSVTERLIAEYRASQEAQAAAAAAGEPVLPPTRFSKGLLADMASVYNLDEAGAWEAGLEGDVAGAKVRGFELASTLIERMGDYAEVDTRPASFGSSTHKSARSSQPYADLRKADGSLASRKEYLHPDLVREFGLEDLIARKKDGTPFKRGDSNVLTVWMPQPSDRPRAYTVDEINDLASMADPNEIGSAMHAMLGDARLANNEWAANVPGFGGKEVYEKLLAKDPTMDKDAGFFKRAKTAHGATYAGRGSLWGNPFAKGMPHPDDYEKSMTEGQGGRLYKEWLQSPNDERWSKWQQRIHASKNKQWVENISVMSRFDDIRSRSGELAGRRVFCPGCRGKAQFCHLCGGAEVFSEWAQIDSENRNAGEFNALVNIEDPAHAGFIQAVNRMINPKLDSQALAEAEIGRLSSHAQQSGELSLFEAAKISRQAQELMRSRGDVSVVPGSGALNMKQNPDGSWSMGEPLDLDPAGYTRGRELRESMYQELMTSGVPMPAGMTTGGVVDHIMGKPSVAPLEGFDRITSDSENEMVQRAYGFVDKITGKANKAVQIDTGSIFASMAAALKKPQSGQASADFATGGIASLASKAWGGIKNWWLNDDSQVMGFAKTYRNPTNGRFMSATDYRKLQASQQPRINGKFVTQAAFAAHQAALAGPTTFGVNMGLGTFGPALPSGPRAQRGKFRKQVFGAVGAAAATAVGVAGIGAMALGSMAAGMGGFGGGSPLHPELQRLLNQVITTGIWPTSSEYALVEAAVPGARAMIEAAGPKRYSHPEDHPETIAEIDNILAGPGGLFHHVTGQQLFDPAGALALNAAERKGFLAPHPNAAAGHHWDENQEEFLRMQWKAGTTPHVLTGSGGSGKTDVLQALITQAHTSKRNGGEGMSATRLPMMIGFANVTVNTLKQRLLDNKIMSDKDMEAYTRSHGVTTFHSLAHRVQNELGIENVFGRTSGHGGDVDIAGFSAQDMINSGFVDHDGMGNVTGIKANLAWTERPRQASTAREIETFREALHEMHAGNLFDVNNQAGSAIPMVKDINGNSVVRRGINPGKVNVGGRSAENFRDEDRLTLALEKGMNTDEDRLWKLVKNLGESGMHPEDMLEYFDPRNGHAHKDAGELHYLAAGVLKQMDSINQRGALVRDEHSGNLNLTRFYSSWDVVGKPLQHLMDNPNAAQNLSDFWGRRMVLDEAQDANIGQLMLMAGLSGDWGNIGLIGDLKQEIYGWRGGSRSLMQKAIQGGSERNTYAHLDRSFRFGAGKVDQLNALTDHLKFANLERDPATGQMVVKRHQLLPSIHAKTAMQKDAAGNYVLDASGNQIPVRTGGADFVVPIPAFDGGAGPRSGGGQTFQYEVMADMAKAMLGKGGVSMASMPYLTQLGGASLAHEGQMIIPTKTNKEAADIASVFHKAGLRVSVNFSAEKVKQWTEMSEWLAAEGSGRFTNDATGDMELAHAIMNEPRLQNLLDPEFQLGVTDPTVSSSSTYQRGQDGLKKVLEDIQTFRSYMSLPGTHNIDKTNPDWELDQATRIPIGTAFTLKGRESEFGLIPNMSESQFDITSAASVEEASEHARSLYVLLTRAKQNALFWAGRTAGDKKQAGGRNDEMHSILSAYDEFNTTGVMPDIYAMSQRGRSPGMLEHKTHQYGATFATPTAMTKAGIPAPSYMGSAWATRGVGAPIAKAPRRSFIGEVKKLFKGDRFADGGPTDDGLAMIGEKGREVYWDPSESKFVIANEPMLIEAKKGGFVLNESQLRDRAKRAPRRPALASGGKVIDDSGYSAFARFGDQASYEAFAEQVTGSGANLHTELDGTDRVARVNFKNDVQAGRVLPHLVRNVMEHPTVAPGVLPLGTVSPSLLSKGKPMTQGEIGDIAGVSSQLKVVGESLQKFGKIIGTTSASVADFDKRAAAAAASFGDITKGTFRAEFARQGSQAMTARFNTGVQYDEHAVMNGGATQAFKDMGTGAFQNHNFQPAGLGRGERLNSLTGEINGPAQRMLGPVKRAAGAAAGGAGRYVGSMGTSDSGHFRMLNEAVGNTFFIAQNIANQMGNYADQSMQYGGQVEEAKIQGMNASGFRPAAGSSRQTYGRYFDTMSNAYGQSPNATQYRDLGITEELYQTSFAAGAAASGDVGLDGGMLDEMKSIDARLGTVNENTGDTARYAELQYKAQQQIDRVGGELATVGLWGEKNGMGAQAAIRQVMITGQQSGISMADQAKPEHAGYWAKSLGITQTLANQSPAGPQAFMEAAQYSANVVIPLLDANYKDAGYSDKEWAGMSRSEQQEQLSFIKQTKYGEMVNDLLKGGQEGGAAGRTLRQLVDSQLDPNPRQSFTFALGQDTLDLNGNAVLKSQTRATGYDVASGSQVFTTTPGSKFDMSTVREGYFDSKNNYVGGNLPSSDPNMWNFWTQRANNAFGIEQQRGAIAQADILAGYTTTGSAYDAASGQMVTQQSRDKGFSFGGQTYHGQMAIEAQTIALTGKQINFQMQTNGWQIPFAQQSLAAGQASLAAGRASADAGAELSRAELAESRTHLNAQIGMTGLRVSQFETGQQQAQNDLARQQRSVINNRWMEDIMYGTPGSDQSYKAYANYNRSRLEEGQGAQNAGAMNSLIPTNVIGLENQMGYRSLENQRAMLTYGQSSLSGAAQYEEQMDFLKFQEDYMGKKNEVTGEHRMTEREIQDEALADQKKSLEVNQALQRAMFAEEERQLHAQIGLLDLRGKKNEADIAGSYAGIAAQEIALAQQAKSIDIMKIESDLRKEELGIQQQSNDLQAKLLPEKAAEEERQRTHLKEMLPLMIGSNAALLIWTKAMGGFLGMAEGMNKSGINDSGYQSFDQMLEASARLAHEFPNHIQAIIGGLTGSVQALPGVAALLEGVWDRLNNGLTLPGDGGRKGSIMGFIRGATDEIPAWKESRTNNDTLSGNGRVMYDASRAMTRAVDRLISRGGPNDPLYVQMKKLGADANSAAAGYGGAFAPAVELAGNAAFGLWGASKVGGSLFRWLGGKGGTGGGAAAAGGGGKMKMLGKAGLIAGLAFGGKMIWDNWRGNSGAAAAEAPWTALGITEEEWNALPAQEQAKYMQQIEAQSGGMSGSDMLNLGLTATMIPGVTSGIGKLFGKLGGGWGGGLKGGLKGGALGLGLGIGGGLLDAGLGKMGVNTHGALGTIGTAAGMGAMFGPWGAVAGAGVGLGIVGWQNRKAINAWAEDHGVGVQDFKGYGKRANAWAEDHGVGMEDIKGYATAGWDKAKEFWKWLSDLSWDEIKETITGIPGKLKDVFAGVWDTLTDGDALSSTVLDFFARIVAPFDNLIDKIPGGEVITDAIGKVFTFVVGIWADVYSYIFSSFGDIVSYLKENWDNPTKILGDIWDTIQAVFTTGLDWVTEHKPDLGAIAGTVFDAVKGVLSLPGDWLGDLDLGGIARGAISGVGDVIQKGTDTLGNLKDYVAEKAIGMVNGVIGFFNDTLGRVPGIDDLPTINLDKGTASAEGAAISIVGDIAIDASTISFAEGQEPGTLVAAALSMAITTYMVAIQPTDEWSTGQRELIQKDLEAITSGFLENFDPSAATTSAIAMMTMVRGMGDVFQRVNDSGVFDNGYEGMHRALQSLFTSLQGAINAAAGVIYKANQQMGGPRTGPTAQMARGTLHSKDGWAIVGEAGAELVINPDGTHRMIDHETLVNLAAGSRVYNAAETRAMIGSTTSELVYDRLRSVQNNDFGSSEPGPSAFRISPALDAKMGQGSGKQINLELTINAYPGSTVDRAAIEQVLAEAIEKLHSEMED